MSDIFTFECVDDTVKVEDIKMKGAVFYMNKSKLKLLLLIEIVLHGLTLLFIKVLLEMDDCGFGSSIFVSIAIPYYIYPFYVFLTGLFIVFLLGIAKSYLLGILVTIVFSLITQIVIFEVYDVMDSSLMHYIGWIYLHLRALVIAYVIALPVKILWKKKDKGVVFYE